MTGVEQDAEVRVLLDQWRLRPTIQNRDEFIKALAKEVPGANRAGVCSHVHTRMLELGFDENELLSAGSVYRITTYGANVNPTAEQRMTTVDRAKRRPRKPKQIKDPRVASVNASMSRIREANAVNQHTSMLNAPPNKLNMPLIRNAEQIQQLLVELTAVPPEVAVTQIPIERCRQWRPEHAEWWLEFTRLCEERRAAETPDVPPMRYPSRTKLISGNGSPTEEYQLSAVQATVLAWMREQPEDMEVDIASIAFATHSQSSAVATALERLVGYGLVHRIGRTRFAVGPAE